MNKVVKTAIMMVAAVVLGGVLAGLYIWLTTSSDEKGKSYEFPDDFKIGAASASYQIEGGWNLDGKSPSIWDTLVHTRPELITDRSNADVGADSYHLYKEDVKALKNAGVREVIEFIRQR
jgi:hypothetical protein